MSNPKKSNGKSSAPRRRQPLLLAFCIIAVFAALALTHREDMREWWLNRQSTPELKSLVDHAGADPLLHYIYARRLADAGSFSDAVQPIGRAIQFLTPDSPPDLIGRVFALAGYITAQQNSDRVGAENLRRAAVINKNDVYLHMGKSVLADHNDDAITETAEAEIAVRLAPSRADTWHLLGKAYTVGAELDRAEAAYKHAVDLQPQNPIYCSDLALALGNLHHYHEAEAEYDRARELAPDNPTYVFLSAIGYAEGARTDEEYHAAARRMQDLIALNPRDSQLLGTLAGLNVRFGHYKDARQELEASVAVFPQYDVSWFNLSVVCERLGDHAAAARALARSRQIDDNLVAETARKRALILAGKDVDTSPRPIWEARQFTGAGSDGENHL